MNKAVRRILSLILIVCMTAMLAACSGNSGDDDDSGKKKTSETTPGEKQATPTPTFEVTVGTPTPTATLTPEATPTAEAPPTTEVTPTAEVTPTEEVTPTPYVVDNSQYDIIVTPDKEAVDTRRMARIEINRVQDGASESVFDSESYEKQNRARWEADSAERIRALENTLQQEYQSGSIGYSTASFATEELEYTVDCGNYGRLEVYSHAAVYDDYFGQGHTMKAYTVSGWLIAADMSKKYVVLYESNNLGAEAAGAETKDSVSFEVYYTNSGENADVYDPLTVKKSVTSFSYREVIGGFEEEWCEHYKVWEQFYASRRPGELRQLFTLEYDKQDTTEWPKVNSLFVDIGTNYWDINLAAKPWEVFGNTVLDIYDSMNQLAKGEETTIRNFAARVTDGVYSSQRVLDEELELRADVRFTGVEADVQLYLTGSGLNLLLDESRCRVFETFTSETGEKLEVCGLDPDKTLSAPGDPYDNSLDYELTIRYYPAGADKPSFVFDQSAYREENFDMFEGRFASEVPKVQKEFQGSVVMKETVLESYSLGSFGTLLILETAVCGQPPTTTYQVSGHQVYSLWLSSRGIEAESFICKQWASDYPPEGASDFFRVTHCLMKSPEETQQVNDILSMNYGFLKTQEPEKFKAGGKTAVSEKSLVTIVSVGLYYGEDSGVADKYMSNCGVFDSDGQCLLRTYQTKENSTGGEPYPDGNVRDVNANKYLSRDTDGTWHIMSYTLDEIAAAMDKAADSKSKAQVTEGIMDHIFTVYNDEFADTVFCDSVSIGDNRDLYAVVLHNKDRAENAYLITYVIAENGLVLLVDGLLVAN